MKKSRLYVCLLAGSALIYACGGGSQKQSAESTDTAVAEVPAEGVADSVTLEISANDNMQFSTDQLKVTEGQVVTLNFKHTGKMPKESMGHNWVLLAAGSDPAVFGAAATTAPKTGYIPQDKLEWVIANTPIIGGGEEVSIGFQAPKAGYYKFICSFPGHWGVMQGDFVVSPR